MVNSSGQFTAASSDTNQHIKISAQLHMINDIYSCQMRLLSHDILNMIISNYGYNQLTMCNSLLKETCIYSKRESKINNFALLWGEAQLRLPYVCS